MGLQLLVVLAVAAVAVGDESVGSTSRYMRRLAQSIDLPYNSPWFAVPKGKNAPQQVRCTPGNLIQIPQLFTTEVLVPKSREGCPPSNGNRMAVTIVCMQRVSRHGFEKDSACECLSVMLVLKSLLELIHEAESPFTFNVGSQLSLSKSSRNFVFCLLLKI